MRQPVKLDCPQNTNRSGGHSLPLHPDLRLRVREGLPSRRPCSYFFRPICAIRWALAAALARKFLALAMLKRMFMMLVGTSRDRVSLERRSLLVLSWDSLRLSCAGGRYLYRGLPASPPPPGRVLLFLSPS